MGAFGLGLRLILPPRIRNTFAPVAEWPSTGLVTQRHRFAPVRSSPDCRCPVASSDTAPPHTTRNLRGSAHDWKLPHHASPTPPAPAGQDHRFARPAEARRCQNGPEPGHPAAASDSGGPGAEDARPLVTRPLAGCQSNQCRRDLRRSAVAAQRTALQVPDPGASGTTCGTPPISLARGRTHRSRKDT